MNNKRYIPIIALSALACLPVMSQTRMANRGIGVNGVSVTRAGGNVVLDMTLNLDSLDLPTNTRLVYTPVLKTKTGTVAMPEIVINGRRQQIMYERGDMKGDVDERALVVRRRNGKPQSVDYQGSAPLATSISDYDVEIQEDLCGCGDSINGETYLLKRTRKPLMAFVRPAAEARKERHIDKTAYIDFPVDRIELHADYRRNPSELDSIVNTITMVKEDRNLTISGIDIHGYASPESPYDHNDYLARERAKTLKDYVRNLVNLDDALFSVSHTAENWDGLVTYIRESNLDNKDAILGIIADTKLTPDAREWKIKRDYPKDYRFMLDTWYPALRRSDYRINYTVRPFNVDEAKEIIRTKPQQLSLEEMFLVAQTYEPGSAEFNEVMEVAVRMYPSDGTANLNAACTRLNAGDVDGAKPYLDKAGDSPQAVNARAAYAYLTGNYDEAARLYRQAADAGVAEAKTNLDNM